MRFIFEPNSNEVFKKRALNNMIETVVHNQRTGEVIVRFTRRVRKIWEQTCKNNVLTDHRIKKLKHDKESENYIVYTKIL